MGCDLSSIRANRPIASLINALTITPIIAPQTLECWRCLGESRIALIFTGEQCMEIQRGEQIDFACMDCYERLSYEIAAIDK